MTKRWIWVILALCASWQQAMTQPTGRRMIHPGMAHTAPELDFLKAKIASGAEPWKTYFEALLTSPEASPDHTPRPIRVINVGFYSHPDIGAGDFKRDGSAAYTLALRYYLSGDKASGDAAIRILNAWSQTLDSVTGDNRKLELGIGGVMFLNAAEILRYADRDWKQSDQDAFRKMILNVWYPVIEDFMPGYNGNWDAAICQTIECIGIFTDRRDIFLSAFNHLKSGETNGAIDHYFNTWGQCQESGRDQGHAQMGLGFLTVAAQIAWNQGYDLFSAYHNRLALGYEYTASYMLGNDVRYVRYTNFRGKQVFGDSISAKGRGHFSPIYERTYHHYHDIMGMEMPFTRQALEKSRPEGASDLFLPWASLTSRVPSYGTKPGPPGAN